MATRLGIDGTCLVHCVAASKAAAKAKLPTCALRCNFLWLSLPSLRTDIWECLEISPARPITFKRLGASRWNASVIRVRAGSLCACDPSYDQERFLQFAVFRDRPNRLER